MGLNWQNHEWSKFQSCSYFFPLNNCINGQWMSNDMKLIFGYSDNGRMPYEGKMTARARDEAGAAYYKCLTKYYDAESDPWGNIWYNITYGLGNYFKSPRGAEMTLALGAEITANLFGFSGDLFKTGAEKTKKKEKGNHDSYTNIECTC